MEVMKLLLELSEQLQAAQGEKGQLREKVDDVDQAVAQILGEIQKTAASCSHIRWGGPGRTSLSVCNRIIMWIARRGMCCSLQ